MRVIQDPVVLTTGHEVDHEDNLRTLLGSALACLSTDLHTARLHIGRAWALLQHEQAFSRRGSCRLAGWQVRRLQDYIDAHLDRAIRTAELAAALDLSVSHFSHVCKNTFGMTPLAYVSSRRIRSACQRMLTTDATLTAIAVGHGFCDQSHFIRTFRRHIGITPQAWRRLRESTQRDTGQASETEDAPPGFERKLISVPAPRKIDHVHPC